MAADPTLATLAPEWLAHRYDPGHDAVHLLRVERSLRDRLTFLTDEHLPPGLPSRVVTRRDALAAAPAPAPLHFIFHSAFCCSTLLANAFDRPGLATALKEPVILNDLVGWRRRGADRVKLAETLDGALTLLARPFGRGEAAVVKPSNVAAGLMPVMLAMRPRAKAVLLHAPLRTFVTSVAKKGLEGRLWVRALFKGHRTDGLVQRLGFDDAGFFGQTDLQIAAAGWLAQQQLFADLLGDARLTPRLRSLDSETLLAKPAESVRALAAHYGLAIAETAVSEILAGPFKRDAKRGDRAFGTAERAAEYRAATDAHADEIDKVTRWGEAVAEAAGIPLSLGQALI